MRSERGGLRRVLTLPVLTLYGVGTMVGAGFYALLGEVAARAGPATPLAFLVAAAVAALTALSFAELVRRCPESGGPARWTELAFRRAWLARAVGLAVVATGVVSAGALASAVGGFLQALVGLPQPAGAALTVALLAAVAGWGIVQSAWVAGAITLLETGGLLAVLVARGDALARLGAWPEALAAAPAPVAGTLSGAFLAFYAFVGFEDMVTLAEEARAPRRDVPWSIVLALSIVTLLYCAVALVAVLALPPATLARSATPVAELVGARGPAARAALGWIGVLAGLNGALVQVVMAARILHGLRRHGRLAAWLGAVDPRTRTPLRATAAVALAVLALALAVPLVSLAGATSAALLAVFALMHLALLVLRRRDGPLTAGLRAPAPVPALGLVACGALLAQQLLA